MSKLINCVEILDSKRVPLLNKERENLDKLFPYYGAQGIIDYVDNYIFDGEYILIAEDGNNLKSLNQNICTWASGKFWVNNHAHILGEKSGYNLKYIYYLINSIDLRGYVTGSVQPKLNQENLANIELNVPDIKTQDKTAIILSSLDNKIELNNKINAELEDIAKALYDYWFLQFEFPNKEGKPYKSSGGKMVWNEELKREIPDGWSIKILDDIAEMITKSIILKENQTYEYYSIPSFDDSGIPIIEEGEHIDSNKYYVPNESILVLKLNPQFKRLWYVGEATDFSICSTEFISFLSRNGAKKFLYSVLNSESFYQFMVQSSSGTTGSRKRMQPELMKSFIICYPNDVKIIQKYCEAVQGILNKILTGKKRKSRTEITQRFSSSITYEWASRFYV